MGVRVLQVVVTKEIKDGDVSVTGPERRAANLANQWASYDIEPVICYTKNGSLMRYFQDAKLKVINFKLKSKFNPFSILELIRIIKKNNIDIIHTQGAAALDLVAVLAARQTNIPIIITRPVMLCDQVHYSKIKRKFYELIDQYITLKLANRIVAVSELGRRILFNRYKVLSSKIQVIHNGIDLNKFEIQKNNKRTKVFNSYVNIGMVAHLSPFKGWYDFINVINLINNSTPNRIKAFIIGDGIMRKELESEVLKLGLNGVINFTGYKDNIRELLSNLDLFLFTSHREGLSVAVLEALSSGLPIIATNIGGINEQINIGKNGFVLEKGDIAGMANKCNQLISNEELRLKMGIESRKIAEQRFSEKRMLLEHVECYKDILDINF